MALYVMMSNLTTEGRRTVKETPWRIKEVNKEVEKMGAKILAQYAILGPYDFLTILEAPSHEVISRVAVELGSRGTITTMTMAAMTVDDFARGVQYPSPPRSS